ncbi:MAG: outer membrane protein [Polaribacter sp.]|jgi:outer membrane protein
MFKKIIFVLVSISLSIASVGAAELKIGTVDLQKIFAGAPQRTIIVDKIKKQLEDKSNALKTLAELIEKTQVDAKRDAPTMTDEQKISVQRELQEMSTKAQSMQKNLQEDFQRAQQVEGQKLQEKINQTIQKIAKAEKFDLVLRSETIAFQTGSLDITNKVITVLSNPAG